MTKPRTFWQQLADPWVRLWALGKKMKQEAARQATPVKSPAVTPGPIMGLPFPPPRPLTVLQKTEALILHLHEETHRLEEYVAQLVASEDVAFIFTALQHHRLAVDRLLELLRRRYPKLHLPVTVNITDED